MENSADPDQLASSEDRVHPASAGQGLSRGHHKVWTPIHRRAFKEVSKVVISDWVSR